MPEVPLSESLPDHWRQLGFGRVLSSGGVVGFEWTEIMAYNTATQSNLSPLELSTLVDMSRAYASFIQDKNPFSIAPMDRAYD